MTHLRGHDVACRTGGDEFSVLLPDLSADDCGRLIERLRTGLVTTNGERRIPISLSLGTASWPEAGDSVEALLTRADDAMYADKNQQKAQQAPSGRRALPRPLVTRRPRATTRRARVTVAV